MAIRTADNQLIEKDAKLRTGSDIQVYTRKHTNCTDISHTSACGKQTSQTTLVPHRFTCVYYGSMLVALRFRLGFVSLV